MVQNWKYCFPHVRDRPRQVWEGVYLLPDSPKYSGPGLWLTVDALGNVNNPAHGTDRASFQKTALRKLGEADYWIDGGEMVVRQEDFSKEELLDWVRVWLEHHGLPVGRLREAPASEFVGFVRHATIIAQLTAATPALPVRVASRAERASAPPGARRSRRKGHRR